MMLLFRFQFVVVFVEVFRTLTKHKIGTEKGSKCMNMLAKQYRRTRSINQVWSCCNYLLYSTFSDLDVVSFTRKNIMRFGRKQQSFRREGKTFCPVGVHNSIRSETQIYLSI